MKPIVDDSDSDATSASVTQVGASVTVPERQRRGPAVNLGMQLFNLNPFNVNTDTNRETQGAQQSQSSGASSGAKV